MSYKFNSLPSAQAHKEEIADFWEIQALQNFSIPISGLDITKIVSKEFDELNNEGLTSEEDIYYDKLDEVFAHIEDRMKFSNKNYPFSIGASSIVIDEINTLKEKIYLFLLLCTRFNMKTHKKQNDIDGTLLFEHLCANVAANFFGENAEALVFGTGVTGNFQDKVTDLIKRLGEGGKFSNPNLNPPTKNDDGIDIVVWKNFSDGKEGKIIGFGQCKTGTSSWRDGIHKLKPIDFCNKWFTLNPIFEPLPIVFLTDTMNENFNFYSAQKGFLIFNRFRIMEYIVEDTLDVKIVEDISSWIEGAIEFLKQDLS